MISNAQISWSNFTGGIADQKYQASAGKFYKGFGVDTQRFDVSISKAPKKIRDYSGLINCIYNEGRLTGNATHNIVWTENGVYEDISYSGSTLKATPTNLGYNIAHMKPTGSSDYKLYYFHFTTPSSTKYIHRSSVNGGSFDNNYRSYTSTSGNASYFPPGRPSPMITISQKERIIFTYYNTIWEISTAEVVTKLIDLPDNESIVGLTLFQGQYKIYTTSAFSTSRLYTWDGSDTAPSLDIDLQGIAITGGVVNMGAYDYFMAEDSFYLVAGVQYQKLYNQIGGRLLGGYDDKVIYQSYSTANNFIGEFSQNPGYPKGIIPKYIIDITDQTQKVGYAFDFHDYGIVFGVGAKLLDTYHGTLETGIINSYIESLVFIGDNIQFEKVFTNAILKFSGFTSTNIILYFEIDGGSWIKVWEGNNSSYGANVMGVKLFANNLPNGISKFHTLRIKVEFPNNGNISTSSKFYGVDIFYNQEIGK